MANYNLGVGATLDSASELLVMNDRLMKLYDDLLRAVASFQSANVGQAIDGWETAKIPMEQGHVKQQTEIGNASRALEQMVFNIQNGDARGAAQFGG